jgi:hypothetical protein
MFRVAMVTRLRVKGTVEGTGYNMLTCGQGCKELFWKVGEIIVAELTRFVTSVLLNFATECVNLLLRILEVPASNLCPDTGRIDSCLSCIN